LSIQRVVRNPMTDAPTEPVPLTVGDGAVAIISSSGEVG
jgi:hypothetical protein